tara:strand:+ start:894 stop:1358 length:465 start_codon:yes stop_codon:yes gene_type:complete
MKNIKIQKFRKKFSNDFYMLNKVWIEENWVLEDSDKKDLLNPQKIVEKGGQIFFAVSNDNVVGTVAMIFSSKNRFELAKMTVKKDYRGYGIANLLMDRCIEFARDNLTKEVFLISNDSLKIARILYEKYGFVEVKLDTKKYKRGNVKMMLKLTS